MIERLVVISIEVGDVDVGVLCTIGLQNLRSESEFIPDQYVAVVNLVFSEVIDVVPVDFNVRSIVVGHLVGELIRCCHRLVQDDGIGIHSCAQSHVVPFEFRRLAEFLVWQLCICHASTCQEDN